jgi:hypothetical protein
MLTDMCSQTRRFAVILIVFSLLLSACGQLDVVFSPAGTYRVSARVDGSTLDECSILNVESQIRPYFVNSVANDPDITGLTVFLQTLNGEIVGKKVRYTTDAASLSPAPLETEAPAGTGDTAGTPAPAPSPSSGTGDTSPSGAGNGNTGSPPVDAPDSSGDSPDEGEESPGPSIRGKITIIEPQLIYHGDELVYITRLDQDLPLFPLPADLEIGEYTLVFQILGERGILNSAEKPVLYLGDAEFTLDDIQSYLPGISEGSPIVPPGITIMLEARVAADERLDPYLVWYNGKKRIGEGLISGGLDRLLWKAPEQTGFNALRVEAFPFQPRGNSASVPLGRVKELSLPVSSKYSIKDYFAFSSAGRAAGEEAETPTRWYQFRGNLQDSAFPGDAGKNLVPGGNAPQWQSQGGIYGTPVGAGQNYSIPDSLFFLDGETAGSGKILFRIALLGPGSVFSGSFTLQNSIVPLRVEVSYTGTALVLTYALQNEPRPEIFTLNSEQAASGDFITLALYFAFDNALFQAGLSLNQSDAPAYSPGVSIPGPLTGAGTFRLGSEAVSATRATAPGTASPAATTAGTGTTTAAAGNSLGSSAGTAASNTSTAAGSTAAAGTAASSAAARTAAILDEVAVVFRTGAAVVDQAADGDDADAPDASAVGEDEPGQDAPVSTDPAAKAATEASADTARAALAAVQDVPAAQSPAL